MSVLRSLAFGLSLVLGSAALAGAPGAVASEGETAKIDRSVERKAIDRRAAAPDQEFFACGGSSRVKVKVEADADGVLEVVGVVFSEGEHEWSWKFKHDNDFSAKGTVRAKEREVDRSFRVVSTMVNLLGPDLVTFRAENNVTREVCVAEIRY